MVRLQCPRCQNVIEAAPGMAPTCPKCGFTGPVLGEPVPTSAPSAPAPQWNDPNLSYPHHAIGAPPEHYPPQTGVPQAAYGGTAHGVPFAGFWLRVVSWLIDFLILGAVTFPITYALSPESAVGETDVGPGAWAANGISLLAGWLYHALMESSQLQASLGKMALGLRVTDLEARRISFARATGRYFGKILSAAILLFGFFMIGWTQKKQGLHDIMAGTLVYKKDHVPVQPNSPPGAPAPPQW